MEPIVPKHLEPSELGTKQYWEDAYNRELENHKTSPDDEGTIWFSDSGAEEKMVDLLDCYADDGVLFRDAINEAGQPPSSFLDLGTGNGHLLFSLRQAGWDGVMVGVDYSKNSVELAQQIGLVKAMERAKLDRDDEEEEEDFEESDDEDEDGRSRQPVHFYEYDLFNPTPIPNAPAQGFDVILDKGTFDAISLSQETAQDGRRICEQYGKQMLPMLRKQGYFLITSCNWAEDELKAWFEVEGLLSAYDKIEYPSFTFGGKKGSSVVTLCFQKL